MVDFDKIFQDIHAKTVDTPPDDYVDSNDAIFTPEQLMDIHCNAISRIIRWLFIKNRIGKAKYTELHKAFANREGMREDVAGSDRGNTRKGLYKDKLSWKFLTEHILPLLNLQVVDLILKVEDKDGKLHEISLSESSRIPKDFDKTLDSAKQIVVNTTDAMGNRVALDSKETEKV